MPSGDKGTHLQMEEQGRKNKPLDGTKRRKNKGSDGSPSKEVNHHHRAQRNNTLVPNTAEMAIYYYRATAKKTSEVGLTVRTTVFANFL